jgi:hypothetical protein
MIFTAEAPSAGFEEVPEDEPKPAKRRPAPVDDDDDDDDDLDDYGDRRPRRRWRQPHRGTLILVLGILSLVICGPLGIASWVMGNTDLAAMRRGEMDREGEGMTQAGRICGMIACVFMLIACVVYGLIAVVAIAGGGRGKF